MIHEQRLNFLRRLNYSRREIEQYLRDLACWNELQRSQGGETLPEDLELVAMLAQVDQQIQEIRRSQ